MFEEGKTKGWSRPKIEGGKKDTRHPTSNSMERNPLKLDSLLAFKIGKKIVNEGQYRAIIQF